MKPDSRNLYGLTAGTLIGTLGGLIGMGGIPPPVLVGHFRLNILEAVILNKAMSLVVVAAALVFRGVAISPSILMGHADVIVNLLAGSLLGAWWAAGYAITMSRVWLNRVVMVLLVGFSVVMLTESALGRCTEMAPHFSRPDCL